MNQRPGRGRRLTAAVLAGGILALAGLGVAAAPSALAATSAKAGSAAKAGPALLAHAALASTYPADGSVVAKAPEEVTATFDQPIGITTSSLAVYTPEGNRADDGDTTLANPEEIAVTLLPGLGTGTYTAVWHVISADTHPVSGVFTFSIGTPSATRVPALSLSPNQLVSTAFTAVRWVEYMTFALLCGAVAFLIVCWPAGAQRAGVIRLVTLSWAGLLLSTLFGLLLQGPYAANDGIGQIFNATLVQSTLSSKLGTMSQARELMAFLAGGAATLLLPRLPRAGRRGRIIGGAAWAILTTAVAASWAVYDHASTGIESPSGIPVDIIHLDAMAIWIGGLAVLAGFALRRPADGRSAGKSTAVGNAAGTKTADWNAADDGAADGAANTTVASAAAGAADGAADSAADSGVAVAVSRFSSIALGCVVALVASGAYETWREVGEWGALFRTSYGQLILAKVAGLIVVIGLGYLARHYIQRGLRPAVGAVGAVAEPSLLAGPAEADPVGLTEPTELAGTTAFATPYGTEISTGHADPRNRQEPADLAKQRSVHYDDLDLSDLDFAAPCPTSPSPPGPNWVPAMRLLRRSVAVELAIATVILAFTSILVNVATGRESYAPTFTGSKPFNTGGPGGVGTVHVFVGPARLGPNTIDVYLTGPAGHSYVPAQVTADLYYAPQDLGPEQVTLTSTAPGQYRTTSAAFGFTGGWTMTVTVRSDAFDETTVGFSFGVH